MTCWEWLEHQRQTELPTDAEHLGGVLRELHRALAGFGGELGDLGDVQVDIERLLDQLRPTTTLSSTAIDVLRAKLHAFTDEVFASPLPAQPLHGDASLSNLLRVQDELVWNDFEDVCRGPAQWDVAGFLTGLRNQGADPAFTRRVLDAYGDLEEDSLAPFTAAHAVYDTVWRVYDSQRHR
jgi:Ser/Thr protein kinase RdoA (MazF antagonist)